MSRGRYEGRYERGEKSEERLERRREDGGESRVEYIYERAG